MGRFHCNDPMRAGWSVCTGGAVSDERVGDEEEGGGWCGWGGWGWVGV